MAESTEFQRELDRQLALAQARIAQEFRDISVSEAIAALEAWSLILRHQGPVRIVVAEPYGVAPRSEDA